jgi:hypothetical protein
VTSIWKYALGEILLGQRGITKISHLWLPLATILLSGSVSDLEAGFYGSIGLFFVVLFKVMFSIQVNDLCDRREDKAVGKERWISHLPLPLGVFISTALAAAGFTIIIFASGSIPVALSYTASILFGLFYSLPPGRFKERGIWGLIVYALAATTIYVLVPWVWFESSLVVLGLLFLTVFLDKWVQVHFHQVVDYQADLKNRTQTYAVKVGLARTRKTLRMASLFASFSMGCLLVYIIFFVMPSTFQKIAILGFGTAIIAGSGLYVRTAKKKAARTSDLARELSWMYLGLTYFVFGVFPPVGFLLLAFKEPLLGIPAALSALSLLGLSWHSIRYKYT